MNHLDHTALDLYWLPIRADWRDRLSELEETGDDQAAWALLASLAGSRLDFTLTNRLDRARARRFPEAAPKASGAPTIRLAMLGSSNVGHLAPSLRVAALRRNLWLETYEPDYGQYFHALNDPSSALRAFRPTCVLFAQDANDLVRGVGPGSSSAEVADRIEEIKAHLRLCWRLARETFRCQVIQQTLLPVFQPLLGSNEHRLAGSRHEIVNALNSALRALADEDGVDLLALDDQAAQQGLRAWHDPVMWLRAKQGVRASAAPYYGDLVARLVAARQGRSAKCLILDLDNTLWGGVIGDDGLENIVLGQGSAEGEAFANFQSYAREQTQRGVILAVCSKNDESVAWSAFDEHPEMILKREHIACFVANWQDKAANIRSIAQRLNIGLDSLVFVDDNPFERSLVRLELPMVAVPEMPEDPALYAQCVADAGYFEGVTVTEEDKERTQLYTANAAREALQTQTTDLPSYLKSLGMEFVWSPFDPIGLPRIVQLINKTNQFNLVTKRYSEEEVRQVIEDPKAFGLQIRLLDRFGDNGVIAILIGRMDERRSLVIDTWLMSCRVLGRQVEEATLALVCDQAKRLGAHRIIGEYRATPKNGMVRDHYGKLGFRALSQDESHNRSELLLSEYRAPELLMEIRPPLAG